MSSGHDPTGPEDAGATRISARAAAIALAMLVVGAVAIMFILRSALAANIGLVQGSVWEKWIGECQWQIEFEVENLSSETLRITDVFVQFEDFNDRSGTGADAELAPGTTWAHTFVEDVPPSADCTIALEDLRHGPLRVVYVDSAGTAKAAELRF